MGTWELIFQKRIPLKNKTLLGRLQNFLVKVLFAKSYDKHFESDRQMLLRVGRKFAVLCIVILMFDTLLHGLLGLIDFVIHIMHLIIQAIEYSLLISLQHWFNVDQQQSEMIVVNATIIIALYLSYRLVLATPGLIVHIKQYLRSAWMRYIERESSIWRAVSLNRKIKCLGIYSLGTTCLLFLMA